MNKLLPFAIEIFGAAESAECKTLHLMRQPVASSNSSLQKTLDAGFAPA
jgi:hypothetical protein